MGFIQRKHCSCFQEECAAFLGKPKEAVTEEEVLKRLAKEAEIIEQAINGDLFEVCGPQFDDFCRHGWFLDEKDAAKFAEEEYPDFSTKTRISEQSTNLKQPN